MTLPASGPITLDEILAEYGAPQLTTLSKMVRGGDYVPQDNIGGQNSGIPTSPPLYLTDFYGGEGNPNPYQILDELLEPPSNGSPVVRLLSNKRNEGIFVPGHDGAINVDSPSQFVIDMKLRLGAGTIVEPDSGNITSSIAHYGDLRRVMGILVGLTTADPASASDVTLLNGMFGWKIDFYDTEEQTGIAVVQLGSVTTGFSRSYLGNDGWVESVDNTYETKILPSLSNYVNLRFERGNPTNSNETSWSADWILKIYENDNWTSLFETIPTANGGHFFNRQLANLGGYLVMAISNGHPSGNLKIDIGDVRAFSGGQLTPW